MRKSVGLVATMLLLVIVGGCGSGKSKLDDTKAPEPTGSGGITLVKDPPLGLDLRLSNGKQSKPDADQSKVSPGTKLAAADVAKLLLRAEPIDAKDTDQKAFALRPNSAPPPRTGEVIKTTFPADPSTLLPPPSSDAGKELAVLRYMPEGEVPLAPNLTVTFSQPMIAVTSQDDAAVNIPVKLTPTPKGKWRWLGTRTIIFDPEVRFPQATTYRVEVPAGTKSAVGGELKTAVSFSFETPTPTVVSHFPGEYATHRTDTPMFLLFDQKIDAAAVAGKLVVKTATKTYQVTQLDAAQIAANDQVKDFVEAAKQNEQDGRWLVVRATEPFPTNTAVSFAVSAGTPSAEGPNPTKAEQVFSFRTYPPLKVLHTDCGYNRECRPNMPFTFELSNAIDVDKLEDLKPQFVVTPALARMKLTAYGQSLVITGDTQPRTTYKVTLPAATPDMFGQTLGAAESHDFAVGVASPTFYGPSGLVVLDPAAKKPTLDFFATNYTNLKVQLYKVAPEDYWRFLEYSDYRWDTSNPRPIPGTKVYDAPIKTNGAPDKLTEVHVDLAPGLAKSGLGHVIAIVEPSPWSEPYGQAPKLVAWVQATKLAVDVHSDYEGMHVLTTELATGKVASGASVALDGTLVGSAPVATDASGLAKLAYGPGTPKTGRRGAILRASKGEDSTFIFNYNEYSWSASTRASDRLAFYVVDDRKLYRPGEEVSLKGWLRTIEGGKGGDVAATTATEITYVATDSRNNKIAEGKATINAAGAFDAKFTLPTTPNLGRTGIVFTANGQNHYHQLRTEEFRRPEFEVAATASQGPFLVGQGGDVTVSAKYYAGGGLPGAPVVWNANARSTTYTPPNRDDYSFGTWTPWWISNRFGEYDYYGEEDFEYYGRGRYGMPGSGSAKDKAKRAKDSYQLEAKTDGGGEHVLHLDFLSVSPNKPMQVTTTASVTDVNRQQWSAATTMIVHPARYYVGLKSERPFVDLGTPFEVSVIGVDLDGKIAPAAKIELKAVRIEGDWEKGEWKVKELDPQTCAVVMAKDAGSCKFGAKLGGEYKITATITDPEGRANETTLTYWVTGGDRVPAREVSQEEIKVIPDKKEYAVGNTAELLVLAPFFPAEGVLTWRRSGIVKLERVTFDGPTKVVKVPIDDTMTPNLTVQLDLVGTAPRLDDDGKVNPKLPRRPAYAQGQVAIKVPPKHRTLAVTATPEVAKIAPGGKTTVAVDVKDAAGKPVVGAEIAVIVVDESILSLAAYSHPAPIDTFYGDRAEGGHDMFSHSYVKLARPTDTAQPTTGAAPPAPAPGASPADAEESGGAGTAMALDEGKMGRKDNDRAEGQYRMKKESADPMVARGQAMEQARNAGVLGGLAGDGKPNGTPPPVDPGAPIAVRSNFNPLAAFAPVVTSDANGRATAQVTMPDNLTRYRIIAIASSGTKQFGKGESAITARLPLMVRPSAPRFLNFGDTFQFPVVVQNQTDAPMTVKLAIRATNAKLTDGDGRSIEVAANDRVEVRFPAAAAMAGTARFQIVGTAGDASDAAEVSLPVWTPATTEAFATYGVVDQGATAQPIALPGQVVTEFGGLEVTTSSTNLQALTDAFLYIVHYKFECAEQRSSRVLSIVALQDVLSAFDVPDMPSAAAIADSMAADMLRLKNLQNGDGGFPYWERGRESEPYLTVYVANALQRAKDKGHAVPQEVLDRAKEYLRNIENYYPWFYGPEIRRAISAYALSTRKLMNDLDIPKAKRLYADGGGATKLQMETLGWLLATFAGNANATTERAEIIRQATNRVSETAGAANFTTKYDDGGYLLLASDRRVDAIMLDALIQEQPANDLIPKLVTGLLAHRKAGRWLNTQENTWALIALDRYFRTYEKITPNFVARVWLGNDYAGDHAFKGRTTESFQLDIPMALVATHDKQNLTIQKDGAGRMYYRVGMTYAPASLSLAAADYGFVVTRTYEGIDDPKDVTKDAQGVWHIKAGARVRVKLAMANENRRYHVALVDPMPAGLEAVNPTLGVSAPVPRDEAEAKKPANRYAWWYRSWYEHQNMRDERVEAFTQLLWEGVHDYAYVARATTPGNYVVPPAKAEEMYMPETFGRSASDRVIVE